jgi:hypothetical protein
MADTPSSRRSTTRRPTGRLSRPKPWSFGAWLHAPSAAQASHSVNVTSNLPTAKGRASTTSCTGVSSLAASEPIANVPAGTTTISGHAGQSLKLSPGLRQRRASAVTPAQPDACASTPGTASSHATKQQETAHPVSHRFHRVPLAHTATRVTIEKPAAS